MKDISIADLADLVVADVSDLDDRIEKMFDWHFSRDTMITRWVLGAAGSITAGLLVAFFRSNTPVDVVNALVWLIIPLSIASYGLVRIFRLRSIHRQFATALKIATQLREIRPFLVRYREHPR